MALSLLTRRLATGLSLRPPGGGISSLSVGVSAARPAIAAAASSGAGDALAPEGSSSGVRWMSKKSKRKDDDDVSNQQHEEWVKFQQSISVDGFETGQIKTVTSSGLTGRKDRGGKQLRRRREKELALQEKVSERDRMLSEEGGGQFPPLRYSDEETERLLAEAYANIPPRAGKRGTRNLKRQRNRWFRVYMHQRKKKHEKRETHERRMAKRSRIVKEVLKVKEEAEEVRVREKEYQEEVLRAWAEKAVLAEEEDGSGRMRQMVAGEQKE